MSHRHHILDQITLGYSTDDQLHDAIDALVMEHQMGYPSIEERCARAEALAILAIELLRRIRND